MSNNQEGTVLFETLKKGSDNWHKLLAKKKRVAIKHGKWLLHLETQANVNPQL